jgi:HEAT repeat protein
MGLFDFISGDPAKRESRAIEKAAKALATPYGPPENRLKALDNLAAIGTADAIYAMLKRFTVSTPNGIVDQDEKAQVAGTVARFGAKAVAPITRFLRDSDDVTRPLRILSDVAGPAETARIVIAVLQGLGTEYTRVPHKKVELLAHLDTLSANVQAKAEPVEGFPDVVEAVLPFLEDVNDDVQLRAIELLLRYEPQRVRDPLVALLLDGDSSNRLRVAIAAGLAARAYPLGERAAEVAEVLPDRFAVDKDGVVRKR